MSKNDTYLHIGDVLETVKHFSTYLLKQHRWLWGTTMIFVLLGGVYGLVKQPSYLAKGTFILEEKSIGGGLSGLASQFGVDLGSIGGGNSNIFAGDNILDILRSEKLIEKVLLTPIDSSSKKTLADHYLDFMNWRSKYPETKDLSYALPGNQQLKDSILQLMHEKIVEKQIKVDRLNKKGSIIEIQTSSRSQLFSKLFTERLIQATIDLYITIKTGSAKENVNRLEKRADSLHRVLNIKSYQSATEQILDANLAFRSTMVPSELSSREKMVVFGLYSEVIKNLELARMSLVNQTPIIQKLDMPRLPLKDTNKKWWIWALIGGGIGFGISFFLLFYNYPGKV